MEQWNRDFERAKCDPLYGKGQQLQSEKQLQAALDAFLELGQKMPYIPQLSRRIGVIYLELSQLELAVEYFSKAIQLWPTYEKASRGLFLALAEAGRDDDAWNEAHRFLALVGHLPEEYELMLMEAHGEITGEEFDRLAAEMDEVKGKIKFQMSKNSVSPISILALPTDRCSNHKTFDMLY
jgi:tetratricopeptide (TPR) repeat protein